MGNCGAKTGVKEDVAAERGLPSELTLMKKQELQKVLDADAMKREDGDAWFIVEAAWVQRWLAFVQGGDSVKKPGPIRNDNLLRYDQPTKAWVPKPLLRSARKEHMGHYRRVNPYVWQMWARAYPGSGPSIWVATEPFEDSSNWQLDPAFDGATKGRSSGLGGGGGTQARGGGEAVGGGTAPVAPGGAAAARPGPAVSLAIGEMEDDQVGQETALKAAAFFDVALDSPRISARGGSGGAAGRPLSLTRGPGSSGGGGVADDREPSAAEKWMYGSVDADPRAKME